MKEIILKFILSYQLHIFGDQLFGRKIREDSQTTRKSTVGKKCTKYNGRSRGTKKPRREIVNKWGKTQYQLSLKSFLTLLTYISFISILVPQERQSRSTAEEEKKSKIRQAQKLEITITHVYKTKQVILDLTGALNCAIHSHSSRSSYLRRDNREVQHSKRKCKRSDNFRNSKSKSHTYTKQNKGLLYVQSHLYLISIRPRISVYDDITIPLNLNNDIFRSMLLSPYLQFKYLLETCRRNYPSTAQLPLLIRGSNFMF